MSTKKQEVTLGSGVLYIAEFSGSSVPADLTLETEGNKIGGIKGGASISYKPTFYQVKDDANIVYKTFLTDSEIVFKSGILTWNTDVLKKLSLNGEVSSSGNKETLKIGKNGAIKSYVIRFVHTKDDGKKIRITIVGTSQNGFELVFDPEKETVIDAEFIAGTLDSDGTKLIIEEETAGE